MDWPLAEVSGFDPTSMQCPRCGKGPHQLARPDGRARRVDPSTSVAAALIADGSSRPWLLLAFATNRLGLTAAEADCWAGRNTLAGDLGQRDCVRDADGQHVDIRWWHLEGEFGSRTSGLMRDGYLVVPLQDDGEPFKIGRRQKYAITVAGRLALHAHREVLRAGLVQAE